MQMEKAQTNFKVRKIIDSHVCNQEYVMNVKNVFLKIKPAIVMLQAQYQISFRIMFCYEICFQIIYTGSLLGQVAHDVLLQRDL